MSHLDEACGPYGHDIHFREICAAWKRPPVTEMTKSEFKQWKQIEKQAKDIKRNKEIKDIRLFRQAKLGIRHSKEKEDVWR